MFEGLFAALRDEGVPVALDEWLMLHDALDRDLHQSTLSGLYLLREMDALQKRPSTAELVDWVQALAVAVVDPDTIVEELPFMGVVLKKQADLNVARRHLSIRARRAAMHEGRG